MTRVYLNRIAFALGETVREVEEAHRAGLVQSSPEQLRLAGFRSHHTCEQDDHVVRPGGPRGGRAG